MASFTPVLLADQLSGSSCSKRRRRIPGHPKQCEKHRWGRFLQWNLGGQPVELLDVVAKDADVLCVQEIARDEPGWGEFECEHFQWITHRAKSQWRGVGVGIAVDKFDCVIKKVACSRGIWVLIRVHGIGRIVCGSLHAHTGTTNTVYQAAIHESFHSLPAPWRQYPLVCGVDANETPNWILDEHNTLEAGHCSANLNVLLQEALQVGCTPLAPTFEQRLSPTHFPRDATREGRQIDMILRRHVDMNPVRIEADRRHCVGSDHAALLSEISANGKSRVRWGNDSRARWVVSDLPSRVILDDEDVAQLAKDFTRPRASMKFVDDEFTLQAIQTARLSKSSADWKTVHKMRKSARKRWQEARLQRVLQGDWDDFRQIQNEKKRKRGWWGHLLAGKSSSELTGEVQKHLETKMVDPGMDNWDQQLNEMIDSVRMGGNFVEFSLAELRGELQNMKCKSAVGPDGIGVHLLRNMASHDGLGPQLLSLINHIVRTLAIPSSWSKSFLALLAKVDFPGKPSELRPISVSSAFNKLVNRLVCSRALPFLRRGSRVSACGKGRQAADLIGTVSRIRDVVHEWHTPALICKLDVAGAFDRVDRRKVAKLLMQRLQHPEINSELCYLLSQLRVHVLVGKVPGGGHIQVCPNNGIKQGAPESAEIFGLVVDTILGDLTASRQWKGFGESLPGLDVDVMFTRMTSLSLSKTFVSWGVVLGLLTRVCNRLAFALRLRKLRSLRVLPIVDIAG